MAASRSRTTQPSWLTGCGRDWSSSSLLMRALLLGESGAQAAHRLPEQPPKQRPCRCCEGTDEAVRIRGQRPPHRGPIPGVLQRPHLDQGTEEPSIGHVASVHPLCRGLAKTEPSRGNGHPARQTPGSSRSLPPITLRDLRHVAAPLLHDTPDELANPRGRVRDWKAGECEPYPDAPCRNASLSSATTALSPTRRVSSARCWTHWARRPRASRSTWPGNWTTCGTRTAWCAAGRPTAGRRSPGTHRRARRSSPCPARPTATWPPRVSTDWRNATRTQLADLADLAAEHEGKRITFAGHPGRPRAGHHLPGVVRLGDWRTPLLALHRQRRTPQALAHPHRTPALLPRPGLDDRAWRTTPGLLAAAELGRALRRAVARMWGSWA